MKSAAEIKKEYLLVEAGRFMQRTESAEMFSKGVTQALMWVLQETAAPPSTAIDFLQANTRCECHGVLLEKCPARRK